MEPDGSTVDVLRYQTDDGPVYRAVPAGDGEAVVAAHERELRKRRSLRWAVGVAVALTSVGYGLLTESPLLGLLGGGIVAAALLVGGDDGEALVPELVERSVFRHDAARQYGLEVG
ncbi:hypothetical protein [Halosimplex salinum]|uniref:hypothetical protein n=1 Tax=Halosimplex salinum TaxID=1710538 RepID=UPI000F45F5BA|nr:hypothetical protein [Halosimplex salinum]